MRLDVHEVTVKLLENDKTLIENITFSAQGGDVIGLMGPSGAGKTTLISYITSGGLGLRKWKCQGDVKINGDSLSNYKKGKRLIGFAWQHDHMHEDLTAWQTVYYKGQLKTCMGKKKLKESIETYFKRLKLEQCRDTPVGGERVRGCSGGQRKKVMLASELITKPPVIVLDEPTTGLDAHSASVLMSVLADVVKSENCIAIVSLHQPASPIFNSCSRVLFLARGRLIGNRNPHDYYNICNTISLPCPGGDSICEHIMELIQNQDTLNQLILNKDLLCPNIELLDLPKEYATVEELLSQVQRPSRLTRILVLMRRHFMYRRRDTFCVTRVVSKAIMVLITCLVWGGKYSSGLVDPDFRDQAGFLYYISLESTFSAYYTSVGNLEEEQGVLKVELNAKIYDSLDATLARIIPDACYYSMYNVLILFVTMLAGKNFVGIMPYIYGFFEVVLSCSLACSFSKFWHYTISEFRVASMTGDVILTVGNYFCGFFASIKVIPAAFRWLRNVFFIPLFYSEITSTFMGTKEYECNLVSNEWGCDMIGQEVSGYEVLSASDVVDLPWGYNMLITAVWLVVFELLTALTMSKSRVLRI